MIDIRAAAESCWPLIIYILPYARGVLAKVDHQAEAQEIYSGLWMALPMATLYYLRSLFREEYES